MSRSLAVPLLLVAGACAGGTGTADAGDPQPVRTRAALASVTVANRTPHALDIFYRFAAAQNETRIGRVLPDSVSQMAPVPAGEPLVLIARTPAGTQLVLTPRALALDERWVWRIPADARFVPPPRSRQ